MDKKETIIYNIKEALTDVVDHKALLDESFKELEDLIKELKEV